MVKIWPYFIDLYELQFLFVFQNIYPKNIYIYIESFRCDIIPLNFMGFSFKTFKSKNDINYIDLPNTNFHIDLGRFVGDWTCIIQIVIY
jgi:hypothetical protein